MNIGKYIFAQVIDFIPRYQFDKLVKKYKGDWHAKDLSCYNQLKFRIWNSSRLSILSKCSQSLVILNNLDG